VVPEVAGSRWSLLSQEERDRITHALSADVASMSHVSIRFVQGHASREVQREVFGRGLVLTDREARQRFTLKLRAPKGEPAAIEAIEKALEIAVAEEDPDLREVRHLVGIVLARRPSERLFPAARLLLASGERSMILAGCSLAESLGREELVPDLRRHLDSMDVQIRTTAKQAIDSIREVARVEERGGAEVGRLVRAR
jgi:hypothetical protein